MQSQTDVIVIGAGPIGLSLAIQLKSQGFNHFRIFDQQGEPGDEVINSVSRAIGVHARTLEVFEDVGVTESLIERGKIAYTASNYYNSNLTYRVDYPSGCAESHVKYNWNLMVTQGNTIDVLHQHLSKKLGHRVEWNKTLESFSQDDSGVTATIVCTKTNKKETIRAKYIVGCDGCHSRVRKEMNVKFPGHVYPVKWVVCDLDIDWDIPHDDIAWTGIKNAYAISLPLAGEKEGRFRVTMGMPLTEEEKSIESGHASAFDTKSFTREDCVNFFNRVYPKARVKAAPSEPQSWFKVHCRFAETFSKGRAFLVGDAAHVHSPILGQGMNMGIQDGANLAWKLVSVCRGDSDPSLLKTYSLEREFTDKAIVGFVDKVTRLVITSWEFLQILRGKILTKILNSKTGSRKLVNKVMQLSVNYKKSDSPIVVDKWRSVKRGIESGCRIPDPVYLTEKNRSTRLFETIKGNRFNALIFLGKNASKADCQRAGEIAKGINENYADQVEAHIVATSSLEWESESSIKTINDKENILHDVFGISRPSLYLCRPDRYIAFREEGYAHYSNYLNRIFSTQVTARELVYG